MSTELVAALGPNDFQRETAAGTDPELVLVNADGGSNDAPATGAYRGVSLPKFKQSNNIKYGYLAAFRIPDNLTMGTGLTFKIYLTDDGQNSADLGKVVQVGVTVKDLTTSAATNSIDTAGGTEETVNITLSSTSQAVGIGSLAITTANMTSPNVGDLVLIRVRRIGTATADTCLGRAILLRVEVQNT